MAVLREVRRAPPYLGRSSAATLSGRAVSRPAFRLAMVREPYHGSAANITGTTGGSEVHDPDSVGFRQVLGEWAFPRLFLFRREHDVG